MKFRKRPLIVDAITFQQFIDYGREHGDNIVNGVPWGFRYNGHQILFENDNKYLIPTLEGNMKLTPNDILITGIKGEIYPCRLDIFLETYELVKDNE